MSDMPPPPGATPSPRSDSPAPQTSRGFFARLFDLSFSEFITPSIIKIIFVIGIIFGGLVALLILVSAAQAGDGAIVFGLIFAPLVFFAYVLFARVLAEIYLILFKIEENTRR